MINIFKKLKNKYTPAEWSDLITGSKNILIEEDYHKERFFIVSRIEREAIIKGIDIIYIKTAGYVSIDFIEESIRDYDYRAILNPSYDDIKTIRDSICSKKEGSIDEDIEDTEKDDRNVFIVFDNAENNYFETIEYASTIVENLLDKGRDVLLIIDGFENFRKEKDLNFVSEEYYDFLYKVLKSKATIICSGEPIYEEDAEFDLIFPEFNQYFVGAMSTIDNIRSNDNRKYMLNIIGKIGGEEAINFIKKRKII